MPKIPDITTLGPRPTPTPQAGVSSIDASPIGRAAERVGDAGLALGHEIARAQIVETDRINRMRAEDAVNQLLNAEQDLSTGENGFSSVMGGNAVTRPLEKDYTAQFNDKRKAISEALSTPEQRQIFDSRANVIARGFVGRVRGHVVAQSQVYDRQVLDGAAAAAVSNAATNYGSDDSVDTYAERYNFLADEILRQHGTPQDVIDQAKSQVRDKVWASRLTAEAAKDPVRAYTRLQLNRENMSAAIYHTLESGLFSAADDLMAIRAQQALPKVQSQVVPQVQAPPQADSVSALATAIRSIESGGNPNAVSPQGARGSMQIMPATFRQYAQPGESFDNEDHRTAAAMRKIQDDFAYYGGDVQKTAAAYIGGRGAVRADGTIRDDVRDALGTTPAAYAQRVAGLIKIGQAEAARGQAAVTLATMTPAQAAQVQTGDELIDSLPPQRKLAVLQKAHAQVRQDQQALRQQVEGRERDATAELLVTGGASNPPSREEFTAAYGPVDGERRFQRLQETAQTGKNIQLVKTLPQSDLEALRAQKPAAGDGFAERQRNYELLDHAITEVQRQRIADPVAYALSTKSYGIQPITAEQFTKDIPAVQAELSRRARASGVMAQDYGTAPALLTKAESGALSSALRQAPIPAQKQYLTALYNGVGDINTYKAVLQQVAPDAPTVALAGFYQAKQYQSEGERGRRDVSDLILRGHAILNPPRKDDGGDHIGGKALVKMPKEDEMRLAFNNYVGDAFKDKEKAKDVAWQAAREIYAARQSEEGDDSGNLISDRWKSAIELATGGIEKHKGASIALPWGMSYDGFRDELQKRTEALAPQAVRATAGELANLPLENFGDGRYVFQRGAGYVVDKSGRPLVLDFNNAAPPEAPAVMVPAAKLRTRDFSVSRGGAVTGMGR